MSASPRRLTTDPPPEPQPLPCADKLTFDTRREANAVIHTIRYKYHTEVHSYRCSQCNLWHLSSGSAL